MERQSKPLLWVAHPGNRKTGSVPTAYVGNSFESTRESCDGCALLGNGCYAWAAVTRGMPVMHKAYAKHPERYEMRNAIDRRRRYSRMVRIGAIGDPARADRRELLEAFDYVRAQSLAVVGYTHFWRDEPRTGVLRRNLMASCNSVEETPEALSRGWVPATVLPWDHEGNTFDMPTGDKGLVCPAQTKNLKCNDCRMCDPQHKVWKAGKVKAIGFIDHSPRARYKQRKALPLAG